MNTQVVEIVRVIFYEHNRIIGNNPVSIYRTIDNIIGRMHDTNVCIPTKIIK